MYIRVAAPPEIQPEDGPVPAPPDPRSVLQDARAIHQRVFEVLPPVGGGFNGGF